MYRLSWCVRKRNVSEFTSVVCPEASVRMCHWNSSASTYCEKRPLIIAVEILYLLLIYALLYFRQLWILFRKFNMKHTFWITVFHFTTSTLIFYCFVNLQINLEQAENLIKRHEAFLTTMEANDDKINNVVQFASRLCDDGHFAGSWHNIHTVCLVGSRIKTPYSVVCTAARMLVFKHYTVGFSRHWIPMN